MQNAYMCAGVRAYGWIRKEHTLHTPSECLSLALRVESCLEAKASLFGNFIYSFISGSWLNADAKIARVILSDIDFNFNHLNRNFHIGRISVVQKRIHIGRISVIEFGEIYLRTFL